MCFYHPAKNENICRAKPAFNDPRFLAIDTTFLGPHPTPVNKKQWFDIHPGLTLETIVK